ncbi:MAG: 4Fe-4S dicluster domain-containing protein [Planctomycetes bacterium]|nr:4Fe-4S dicluster domain-containing protein [Planctomycetota bacterium]
MKKPKLRELGEAVKALLRGPATIKFPAEPYVPPDSFRGKPKYYVDDCIGCKACAEVCPSQCIEVVDDTAADPPVRRLAVHYGACIFCGQCELYCTTEKGIRLSTEFDLTTFNRAECLEPVEKELVLCEVCGAVIGCRDHLLWVAERIGAKRYANPTLILLADGELGLVGEQTPRDPSRPLSRSDTMRVLCPTCRRATVLREVWGP